MKRQIKEWSIKEVFEMREQFTFPDYQREPKLWRPNDKQLLIDSIFKDIDIPKLYIYKEDKKDIYEVVDGQQRLWAIWEFINNEYGVEINGKLKKFKDLDVHQRQIILMYELQFTLITDVNDEYLRELFQRLQFGLLLKTGEKLHAMTGEIRDFIFKKMKNYKFISNLKIPKRRYALETLCAQICINSFFRKSKSEFARTRYDNLKYFFDFYKTPVGVDKTFFNSQIKLIIEVLEKLDHYFSTNESSLKNRSLILSLYLFVEEKFINNQSNLDTILLKFKKFIDKFNKRLREESKLGFNRNNQELYQFQSYLSNAPGEKYQIESRHNKLNELFEYYKNHGERIKGDSN